MDSNFLSPQLRGIILKTYPAHSLPAQLFFPKCCQKSLFLHCSSCKPASLRLMTPQEERASAASTPVVYLFDKAPAPPAPSCVMTVPAAATLAPPVGSGRATTIPCARADPATAVPFACLAYAVISDTYATRALNSARRAAAPETH